ncbi:hypothetical protein Lal_00014468, partial [Lupinus albus]
MIKTRLGATAVVMQLPIGAETEFKGVVDLIEMNALVWRDESLGAQWDVVEIPEDMKAKADEYREKLIETVVEIDEEAMEAYLNGKCPTTTDPALVRRGTIDVKFHPMFCGTAFKNKGVQPAARRRCRLPAVSARYPGIKGIDFKTEAEIERHADDAEPLSDAGVQDHERPLRWLADLRTHLLRQARKGRVGHEHGQGQARARRPYAQMHSNSREDIEEAFAGDIVALAGRRKPHGDTLCDPLKPVILERMEFPNRLSRSRSSRSPRATRKRWASRSTVWLPKTRPSASRPTPNPARRSSLAWANFTWTSSSTACVASSRLKPPSV